MGLADYVRGASNRPRLTRSASAGSTRPGHKVSQPFAPYSMSPGYPDFAPGATTDYEKLCSSATLHDALVSHGAREAQSQGDRQAMVQDINRKLAQLEDTRHHLEMRKKHIARGGRRPRARRRAVSNALDNRASFQPSSWTTTTRDYGSLPAASPPIRDHFLKTAEWEIPTHPHWQRTPDVGYGSLRPVSTDFGNYYDQQLRLPSGFLLNNRTQEAMFL